MVVKRITKFDGRAKFRMLHVVDVYILPGIFVATIPDKAIIFSWNNEIALWGGVHVWHKANNSPWKGKNNGIFVFFFHCFRYFFNVHCNGEMISVVQKSKKFLMW